MAKKGPMKNMIGFMATDEHKRRLKALCDATHRDQSDLLRLLIDQAYDAGFNAYPEMRMEGIEMSTIQVNRLTGNR